MPITWTCTCGKSLRIADDLAGKRVKCPACNCVSTAPKVDPGFEVVEETELQPSPPPPTRVREVVAQEENQSRKRQMSDDEEDERPRKKRRADDDGDEDEDERTKKKRRRDEEDDEKPWKKRRADDDEEDDDEEDRPRKKKKQLKKGKKVEKGGHFGMERGILNAGVLGGLAAMVGAVIWFVVGLLNDWIFFYPPVLFVLGMVAMIKGIMNKNED
jgi:hypothetical protein